MDPTCSQSPYDINYEGISSVPCESNAETKTDSNTNNVEDKETSTQNTSRQQIDDMEHKDFDEEKRLLNHCSGIIDGRTIAASAHYVYLSSASSSLASSSETISTISNMPNDLSMPGCSRSDDCDNGNATIKNMIHSKNFVYSVQQEVYKPDFMQKLLNSGTQEKKDFPKGKLYKEDKTTQSSCENDASEAFESPVGIAGTSGRTSSNASSIASSGYDTVKEFNVPSTSNAEKLLGLDDTSRKNEPGNSNTSKQIQQYCNGDEDSEDEGNEEWCTCLSSHEDDDDDEESEHDDGLWLQRKRRSEPSTPQSAKKLCSDGSLIIRQEIDSIWFPHHGTVATSTPILEAHPEIKNWLNMFQSWSNFEKIEALDALIGRCSAAHVRHMMESIEPLFQRDFISLLPKELALTVLGYLQPKDLLRAAQTCRYWRFLADDNLLWKEQCRRIGITKLKKVPRSFPRCASPWKAAYMRQYLIENNWMYKSVDHPIVMRGHDDHVITCLQFYGNRILSGSDDTTLKVWSATTGKCLLTLTGHTGGVWSSQMFGNLVISGSTDRTLRVWNATTGKCLKVLAGHTSTVRCMHLHKNRVVSGSRDATLRVWSIPDGRCLRVLVGHLAAVRCVQFDGKVVVSGAYDYFVKVWNPETGDCLHTLAGHTNRVYSLQINQGDRLIDNVIKSSNIFAEIMTGIHRTLF